MSEKFANAKQFMKTADHVERRFFIELPYDTGIEDIMRADYWRTVSDKVTKFSIVTVIGGKDDIDVDLRCTDSGNGYCLMRIIRQAPYADVPEKIISDYGTDHIEYRPNRGWCIVSRDGSIVESGIGGRKIAIDRLSELTKKEAA